MAEYELEEVREHVSWKGIVLVAVIIWIAAWWLKHHPLY